MRRSFTHMINVSAQVCSWVYTKCKIEKTVRQRVFALFLTLLFVFSSSVPTVNALTAANAGKGKTPQPLSVATPQTAPLSGAVGKADNPAPNGPEPGKPQAKGTKHELVDKRTASTKTFDNGDGTAEVHSYMGQVHYKVNGKWQDIDTSLIEDTNAADSTNAVGGAVAWVKGQTQTLHTYKVKATTGRHASHLAMTLWAWCASRPTARTSP